MCILTSSSFLFIFFTLELATQGPLCIGKIINYAHPQTSKNSILSSTLESKLPQVPTASNIMNLAQCFDPWRRGLLFLLENMMKRKLWSPYNKSRRCTGTIK
jgi:hypothetical protein